MRDGHRPGWFLRRQLLQLAARLLGLWTALAVVVAVLLRASLPLTALAVLLAGVAGSVPWQRRLGRLRRGLRAEVRVGRALRAFPGLVAHSVPLGGIDADHVACGAVLAAVETKGIGGRVALRDGRLVSSGRPLRADPVGQARSVAARLGRETGTRPHPVVCLAWCSGLLLRTGGVLVVSPDMLVSALVQLPPAAPGEAEALGRYLRGAGPAGSPGQRLR